MVVLPKWIHVSTLTQVMKPANHKPTLTYFSLHLFTLCFSQSIDFSPFLSSNRWNNRSIVLFFMLFPWLLFSLCASWKTFVLSIIHLKTDSTASWPVYRSRGQRSIMLSFLPSPSMWGVLPIFFSSYQENERNTTTEGFAFRFEPDALSQLLTSWSEINGNCVSLTSAPYYERDFVSQCVTQDKPNTAF